MGKVMLVVAQTPRAIAPGDAALVTGASSGIGETFARVPAARRVNLLITARPEDGEALERLAGELAGRHGIRCLAVTVNLARHDGPNALYAAAEEHGFDPDRGQQRRHSRG